MNKNSNGKKKIDENDEVEQLLQAAQDEMLLKLSVDSHISRISSNYLHADLDRRFQSLKSRPPIPPRSISSQSQSQSQLRSQSCVELKTALGDDLSARFAALKASSSTSFSSSSSNNNNFNGVVVCPNLSVADDDNEDDEVEKLIRWAKDAVRLDPSPPSDDDNDNDGKDSDNNTDSDDDEPHRQKKPLK